MRKRYNGNELTDTREAEELYEIYQRAQAGDKSALNELFRAKSVKQVSMIDEYDRKARLSNMDGLDLEFAKDDEENRLEDEWVKSAYAGVEFTFSCLNKMLLNKKKLFLESYKNTGCKDGKKKNNDAPAKYYDGEYDVSDLNELMYETVIEIFDKKTDEGGCLTLHGKKNANCPIRNGVSLLNNISYFTSIKVHKRAKTSHLDIYDAEYYDEENSEAKNLYLDKYALRKFIEAGNGIEAWDGTPGRLPMYEESLEWLQKNDIHKLFKITAGDIHAIIETIMDCEETFIAKDASGEEIIGDKRIGFGMRFVTQQMFKELIKIKCGIEIGQEHISKDLQFIEQRLLDHLFFSLNFRIGKAEGSKNVYEKESERFLYHLDSGKMSYIKMFSRRNYKIYEKSVQFLKDSNLLHPENGDLEDGKMGMVSTLITNYQNQELEYVKSNLNHYKQSDWTEYWEAKLKNNELKIRLWTSENIKNPIRRIIDKGNLIVYCGYMNFYFCDTEKKVCYCLPKDKRIISRSNKNHEVNIYKVS